MCVSRTKLIALQFCFVFYTRILGIFMSENRSIILHSVSLLLGAEGAVPPPTIACAPPFGILQILFWNIT